MLFENIAIIDENFEHKENCYVGILGDRIDFIARQMPEDAEKYGDVYDGTGKVLLPGFVNAHSHSAMTLLRGYAENLALSDWLNTRIFPFEAKLDDEAIYDGTMLAAAEMLRFGITSTTDMYFGAEANSKAVLDSGIKMNLGVPVTCFDERGIQEMPVHQEWKGNIEAYHGAGDGRLLMDLAIHAEYTSTPRIVQETAALAGEWGLRLQTHLSETKSEHEECKARHGGMTPAQYFSSLGAFDVPMTAAHCVWLEGEDFDILRDKGVTVASCPISNLKLASGFVDATTILKHKINFALGTDSVASNNNLNMFEEMKMFATLFKATSGDPTAITPTQALYAATRAGAVSQGRMDTGLIKEGFKADLIVLDVASAPHMRPCHNLLNNLVFSAIGSEVALTMVDGRVLYENGLYTSLDIEACIYNAEQSFARVKNRMK
ncbi:MAG: amidohydrolase [Faecalimonas sp.]|nr:amidohydrolase [Faecalimonas sp.]